MRKSADLDRPRKGFWRGFLISIVFAAVFANPCGALAENADAHCLAASGTSCSPLSQDHQAAAAASSANEVSHRGRMIVDRAPANAEADAVEAEAISAGAAPDSRAANSSFTFYSKNSSRKQIGFKFFSKTREWVWPAPPRHWISPPDRKLYVVRLICQKGEKVCFGGWWTSNPRVYWGVGPRGDKGCSACCYFCNGGRASVNFVR